MKIIKEPPQICKPQIKLDEYRRLVFLHAPALGILLDNLDAGINPEPLAVMAAISQGVAYLTNSSGAQGNPLACGIPGAPAGCSSC